MALTVHSYSCMYYIPYTDDKPYSATSNFHWYADCTIRGKRGKLHFYVKEGHKVDGASVPWPINKVEAFRNWYTDKGNPTKRNCAGVGHDILYMKKGEVKCLDKPLDIEECDDYYRGMKRCDGFGRLAASTQDFFLQLAHNKRHWGNDGYGVMELAEVEWEEDK